MKTLEELKALGVKELQVSNGQAVAVNPYDAFTAEWLAIDDLDLYLPCAESVKEGRYSIDRFEEQPQWYSIFYNDWRWDADPEESKDECRKTRTLLILSEPVAESEIAMYQHHADNEQMAFEQRNEVAEKPEGESIQDIAKMEWENRFGSDEDLLHFPNASDQDVWTNGFTAGYESQSEPVWTLEDQIKPEGEPVETDNENYSGIKRDINHLINTIPDRFDLLYQIDKTFEDFYRNEVENKIIEGKAEIYSAARADHESETEAEPVESAEERSIQQVKDYQAQKLGYSSFRDLMLNPKPDFRYQHLQTCFEKAMEEYASLRVAQEKAELIKKLEAELERVHKPVHTAYVKAGIREAINLIQNS